MGTEGKLRITDVFVEIRDPRQAKKVEHAALLNRSIRQHWRVENSLHWCMNVVLGDDRTRARTDDAAHDFSVMRHFALNLSRLPPVKRRRGLKVRRLVAATSNSYRAEIPSLV